MYSYVLSEGPEQSSPEKNRKPNRLSYDTTTEPICKRFRNTWAKFVKIQYFYAQVCTDLLPQLCSSTDGMQI